MTIWGFMTDVCLCGLLMATISAASADLSTTAQFTALGGKEANPLAEPFVAGGGSKGEILLGLVNVGVYGMVDQFDEPYRTSGLLTGWAIHTVLAIRNVKYGHAYDVPVILFPILVLRW